MKELAHFTIDVEVMARLRSRHPGRDKSRVVESLLSDYLVSKEKPDPHPQQGWMDEVERVKHEEAEKQRKEDDAKELAALRERARKMKEEDARAAEKTGPLHQSA